MTSGKQARASSSPHEEKEKEVQTAGGVPLTLYDTFVYGAGPDRNRACDNMIARNTYKKANNQQTRATSPVVLEVLKA